MRQVIQKLAGLADSLDQKGFFKEASIIDDRIKQLKELVDIQCSKGNFDWDPYMHGMANGMILSLSVAEDNEPKFLDAPDKWLAEKTAQLRRTYDYGEGVYTGMDKYKSIKDYLKKRREKRAEMLSTVTCQHKNITPIMVQGSEYLYCADYKQYIDKNTLNRGTWDRNYFEVNVSPYNDIGFFDARPIDKSEYYS